MAGDSDHLEECHLRQDLKVDSYHIEVPMLMEKKTFAKMGSDGLHEASNGRFEFAGA
jgi:hypothetical protein